MEMKKITLANRIPFVKKHVGDYWDQPPKLEIKIDDKLATMSKKTFDLLYEYSTSVPSGHYPGKMWKAYVSGKWWLRWFGDRDTSGKCSNNEREIFLT